jgi:hypothetical protein
MASLPGRVIRVIHMIGALRVRLGELLTILGPALLACLPCVAWRGWLSAVPGRRDRPGKSDPRRGPRLLPRRACLDAALVATASSLMRAPGIHS